MFSVIIPLYNKEKYIQKAIESVINQSYTDFELLIINDGCTDSSLSLVENIDDPRIKIISQNNQGVSVARNFGVENAKYNLIAFLDADDWWHPDFLLEMSNLISIYPLAAVYSSSYYKVKNGKNIAANIGVDKNFKHGYIEYYKTYYKTFWVPVNCSFVVVKKFEFNDVGGFNLNLKFGEDFDLWLRLSFENKFAFINKKIAYSNQDVPVSSRAIGAKKWKKEEHFLFYLEKFRNTENQDLKYLLDGIILRASLNFYLKNSFVVEIKNLISGIDLNLHDKNLTFYYRYPRLIVVIYFRIKVFASYLKKSFKL